MARRNRGRHFRLSYEEARRPLVDLAARDRRWAQGNVQQIQILFAKGFDWLSKVHILAGVMGYMSGLLWLSLIVMGVFIAGWAKFFEPTVVVPADPTAGLRLLLATAIVLTSPKWLAIILWAAGKLPGWNRNRRVSCWPYCLTLAVTALTGADHHDELCRVDPVDADGRRWRLAAAGARPQRLRVERSGAALHAAHDLRLRACWSRRFAISPTFMLQNRRWLPF
jgi:hypothetical protein